MAGAPRSVRVTLTKYAQTFNPERQGGQDGGSSWTQEHPAALPSSSQIQNVGQSATDSHCFEQYPAASSASRTTHASPAHSSLKRQVAPNPFFEKTSLSEIFFNLKPCLSTVRILYTMVGTIFVVQG
jgi:hypothetical protein